MSRPVRTVLILGLIVIGGVVALGMLADRYRRALPMKSVKDLPVADAPGAAPSPPALPPAAPAVEPPASSAAPSTAANSPNRTPAATAAALREVDTFIAARKAMKVACDANAAAMRKIGLEATGNLKALEGKPSRLYLDVMFAIALARKGVYRDAGVPESAYVPTLRAYHDRQAGKPASDPKLAAALDVRQDALPGADLGDYAFLDSLELP